MALNMDGSSPDTSHSYSLFCQQQGSPTQNIFTQRSRDPTQMQQEGEQRQANMRPTPRTRTHTHTHTHTHAHNLFLTSAVASACIASFFFLLLFCFGWVFPLLATLKDGNAIAHFRRAPFFKHSRPVDMSPFSFTNNALPLSRTHSRTHAGAPCLFFSCNNNQNHD